MENHRCEGSLKARITIAKDYRSVWSKKINNDTKKWRIFMYIADLDYDCVHKQFVAEIKYCPFCRKELV